MGSISVGSELRWVFPLKISSCQLPSCAQGAPALLGADADAAVAVEEDDQQAWQLRHDLPPRHRRLQPLHLSPATRPGAHSQVPAGCLPASPDLPRLLHPRRVLLPRPPRLLLPPPLQAPYLPVIEVEVRDKTNSPTTI